MVEFEEQEEGLVRPTSILHTLVGPNSLSSFLSWGSFSSSSPLHTVFDVVGFVGWFFPPPWS